MSAGSVNDPSKSHRSVTWTDPLRLFRTRLFLEPLDASRHASPSPATGRGHDHRAEPETEASSRAAKPSQLPLTRAAGCPS